MTQQGPESDSECLTDPIQESLSGQLACGGWVNTKPTFKNKAECCQHRQIAEVIFPFFQEAPKKVLKVFMVILHNYFAKWLIFFFQTNKENIVL